jgi:hypothetical protein
MSAGGAKRLGRRAMSFTRTAPMSAGGAKRPGRRAIFSTARAFR